MSFALLEPTQAISFDFPYNQGRRGTGATILEALKPSFLQDIHSDVLSGLYATEPAQQAEIGIWQRSHDQRLNREVAHLLGVLGAGGIELLIKMHDAPIDLMRSVKRQLAAELPSDQTYPFFEADITRQVLLFAQHSKAGVVHFRLSSHETQPGDLPDGEFTSYQVTIYDGRHRNESQLLKSALDLRPGNTASATPRQNLSNHLRQPEGRFLFLRLGARQVRDSLPIEENATLMAEHMLGEFAESEFANNQGLPPAPEQQIEQKLLASFAELDLLAESARHPQATQQREKLLEQLPRLLQRLAQPEVLRALSPAAALKISGKLTDLVRMHPALERHPQLPKVIRATERVNQIILATLPAGMPFKFTKPVELATPRQQQLGGAILEGRIRTARRILEHYELPNARPRIEALLPKDTNRLFKPELPVARVLLSLTQVLKSPPMRPDSKPGITNPRVRQSVSPASTAAPMAIASGKPDRPKQAADNDAPTTTGNHPAQTVPGTKEIPPKTVLISVSADANATQVRPNLSPDENYKKELATNLRNAARAISAFHATPDANFATQAAAATIHTPPTPPPAPDNQTARPPNFESQKPPAEILFAQGYIPAPTPANNNDTASHFLIPVIKTAAEQPALTEPKTDLYQASQVNDGAAAPKSPDMICPIHGAGCDGNHLGLFNSDAPHQPAMLNDNVPDKLKSQEIICACGTPGCDGNHLGLFGGEVHQAATMGPTAVKEPKTQEVVCACGRVGCDGNHLGLFENKPAEAQPDEGSGRPMSRADRLRAAKNDSPSLNNANTQNQPMSRAEKLKAARNAPSPISH